MSKLTPILTDLIRRPDPVTHRLERGLILAYTPGSLNDGRYRLTLSRPKVYPSDQETEIIKAALRQALQSAKRPYTNMITEPYLRRGQYHYHVIEWQELTQEPLL